MALDKLVDGAQLDSDLSDIADAIRAKGGTSAQLSFPQGFVDAVDAIQTGTTPTGTKQISITQNGTTTEDVADYASAEITVNVSIAGGYVAADWLDLTKPVGKIVSNVKPAKYSHYHIIRGRTNITSVFLTEATQIADSMFANAACEYIVGPKVETFQSSCCSANTKLLAVDVLGGVQNSTYLFNGDTNLSVLVLRKTTLVGLGNVNSFNNTPFASGKAGGTLYVPNDLISSYQSATNWSTILGYPNNQIKSIESTHTDPNAPIDLTLYYIDGTPIPTT